MFSSIIIVHIPWTITRAPTIWPIPTIASRPWLLAHVHAGAGQPGSRPAGSSTARRFSPTLATEHCSMLLWTNKLDRGLAKLLNVWVNGKETGRIREFPCKKREPKIRSRKSFLRFRFRIYRIFPDFFWISNFPIKMIFDRYIWYTVSVPTFIPTPRVGVFHAHGTAWRGLHGRIPFSFHGRITEYPS